jgi:hypothetical protein
MKNLKPGTIKKKIHPNSGTPKNEEGRLCGVPLWGENLCIAESAKKVRVEAL